MTRRIKIFDTTLRDGEQTPGVNLNLKEKLIIAKRLEALKVDVIEAGFPAASQGDFAAVQAISNQIKESTIAALCRAIPKDIDLAYEAIKNAENGRIHTFIATSPIHMKYKLNMTEKEVIDGAIQAVKYSKALCNNIEFSAEDAYRSNPDFLCKIYSEVIKAGATVINIPDTVGYAFPEDFGYFIKYIIEHTYGIEKADVSIHCHNDLGLAVANSLAGITAGATQVECAINGLGERAGNTALEEIVMAIDTRKNDLGLYTNINSQEIWRTSRLVSSVTGVFIQPNKAIVGNNAFAHESGIHQDGVLKERTTYEIMTPESIGKIDNNNIVLGKHSGRHAFDNYLKNNGISLSPESLDVAFIKFKKMTDKKKNITHREIEAIVNNNLNVLNETYKLISYQVNCGNKMICTTTIELQKGETTITESAVGDGPIESAFKSIERAIGKDFTLKDYSIRSVSDGDDSLGEVVVKIEVNEKLIVGSSISTDIIEASINAYINSINKAVEN